MGIIAAVDLTDPTPVTNWLLFFLAVSGVITLIASRLSKAAKKRDLHRAEQDAEREAELVKLIMEVTRPIQPEANGGLSLTDLHNKVDGLRTTVLSLVDSHLRIQEEQIVVIADLDVIRSEQDRLAIELAAHTDGQHKHEAA